MRRLRVKLYSVLREAVGADYIDLEVDDSCTASQLLKLLEEKGLGSALRLIHNDVRVIADGKVLGASDIIPSSAEVVHVLPPSSGGGNVVIKVLQGNDSVDLNEVVRSLYSSSDNIGAVAIFVGIVKGLSKGESVSYLDYEYSEELMEPKLRELAERAIRDYRLAGAYIAHFVGKRYPGQLTMVVGVSGESRTNVFPAIQWLVDHVKHEAPVWKREVRESGTYFIVGEEDIKSTEVGGVKKPSLRPESRA